MNFSHEEVEIQEEKGPEVILEDEIEDLLHRLKWIVRLQDFYIQEILRAGRSSDDVVRVAYVCAQTLVDSAREQYAVIMVRRDVLLADQAAAQNLRKLGDKK